MRLAGTTFTTTPAGTLRFGAGVLGELGGAVTALGGESVLVVTDPGVVATGIVEAVRSAAGALPVIVFSEVEPNPTTTTVDRGAAVARKMTGSTVVVAVGGGSAMDAAKAIAAAAGMLPVVAVPTTAGTGAETNGFGVIEDPERHCKVYLGDPAVTPRVCLLDPTLTHGLPPGPTAATGVDALVHAVESLVSKGRNPVTEAHAHRALRLVSTWLPTCVADGTDAEARAQLLCGSHLAGLALSGSGLGLVHGIGHAVTAHTGTPHGLALAAVLAEVLALEVNVCAEAFAEMAHDLGVADSAAPVDVNAAAAVARIVALVHEVGAYAPLREHGVTPELVDAVVDGALSDPVSVNAPVRPDRARLHQLVTAALEPPPGR